MINNRIYFPMVLLHSNIFLLILNYHQGQSFHKLLGAGKSFFRLDYSVVAISLKNSEPLMGQEKDLLIVYHLS